MGVKIWREKLGLIVSKLIGPDLVYLNKMKGLVRFSLLIKLRCWMNRVTVGKIHEPMNFSQKSRVKNHGGSHSFSYNNLFCLECGMESLLQSWLTYSVLLFSYVLDGLWRKQEKVYLYCWSFVLSGLS